VPSSPPGSRGVRSSRQRANVVATSAASAGSVLPCNVPISASCPAGCTRTGVPYRAASGSAVCTARAIGDDHTTSGAYSAGHSAASRATCRSPSGDSGTPGIAQVSEWSTFAVLCPCRTSTIRRVTAPSPVVQRCLVTTLPTRTAP
jgi:hypothetical protein